MCQLRVSWNQALKGDRWGTLRRMLTVQSWRHRAGDIELEKWSLITDTSDSEEETQGTPSKYRVDTDGQYIKIKFHRCLNRLHLFLLSFPYGRSRA